jgi:hypothetical protein
MSNLELCTIEHFPLSFLAFVTPAREGMLLFKKFTTPDFFTGSYFIFLELVTFLPVADIELLPFYPVAVKWLFKLVPFLSVAVI